MHRVILVSLPRRAMGRSLDLCWFPDTCCNPITVELSWYLFCSRHKRAWGVSPTSSRLTRTRDQAKDVVDDNPFRSDGVYRWLGTRSWFVVHWICRNAKQLTVFCVDERDIGTELPLTAADFELQVRRSIRLCTVPAEV